MLIKIVSQYSTFVIIEEIKLTEHGGIYEDYVTVSVDDPN